MPRKAAGRQVGVADWLSRSRVADQIAALRRIALRRLRIDDPARTLAGGVDVVGMGRRIGKAAAGPGHSHDIVDERRRPGEIFVLPGREHTAVLVMHAGEALVALAHRQTEPPVVADPLP